MSAATVCNTWYSAFIPVALVARVAEANEAHRAPSMVMGSAMIEVTPRCVSQSLSPPSAWSMVVEKGVPERNASAQRGGFSRKILRCDMVDQESTPGAHHSWRVLASESVVPASNGSSISMTLLREAPMACRSGQCCRIGLFFSLPGVAGCLLR